jgi:histidinol-phosphatase
MTTLTTAAIANRLQFAREIAVETRRFILGYYQNPELAVESKLDTSPVTAADRGAELLIRERLAVAFPDDAVLGEEFPEKAGTSGFKWILDPVDGTKSFIHGVPLFGTLIGVEYAGKCVVGVCGFPALDEIVYASQGQGTWWQVGQAAPQRTFVSKTAKLSEATFCTTNMARWEKIGRWNAYTTMLKGCGLARGWGDCFGHVLVATGRAEIMVDPALNPWDAAALVPILQEAGGHFIDWQGNPTIYGGNGISVNAALKDEILRIVQTT